MLVPQEPPETTGGAASWAGAGAVSCVGADSGAPADSSADGEVGSGVGVGSCEGADPADPSGVACGDCSGGWTGCVAPGDSPVLRLGVRDPFWPERDVPGALSVLPGKALAATS